MIEPCTQYADVFGGFKKLLKQHHLKCTPQREIIFEILYHLNGAVSINQLHRLCLDKSPHLRVGMTTVYRTLWLLEEGNMITSFVLKTTNTQYFEFKRDEHPIYCICIRCGCINRFSDKKIQLRKKEIVQTLGFTIHTSTLKLYGICVKCSV